MINSISARPVQACRMAGWGVAAFAFAAFAALPAVAQTPEFDLTMGVITSPGVYTALTRSVPERIEKATNRRVMVTVSDLLVTPDQITSAAARNQHYESISNSLRQKAPACHERFGPRRST